MNNIINISVVERAERGYAYEGHKLTGIDMLLSKT